MTVPMAPDPETREARVLKVLESTNGQTWEQVCAKLPDLSWNEVFATIDALSRRGKVIIRRRQNDYELLGCQVSSPSDIAMTTDLPAPTESNT